MNENEIIKKYVKIFLLIQVESIDEKIKTIEFHFDKSKTAVCFGTIIDDTPIALASNTIYPRFTYSPETELNTYYLLDILDYGTPIPGDDKFLILEDDSKELTRKYQSTVDWYYNELLPSEEENIISFERARAKILEK